MDRSHLRLFREAPWQSADELSQFVAAAQPVTRRDVEQMIAVLTEAALDKTGPHHRNRCSAFKALCLAVPDASFFAPIADALPSFDSVALRAAAGVLPRVNHAESHPSLCRALGASDPDVRATARVLLEALGGPSALRALTDLVREQRFEGRMDAMAIIVPKARHRAIPLLAAVREAGRPHEQIEAIRWLSDPAMMTGGVAEATAVIERALDATDPRVLDAAFRAFGRLVDEARLFEVVEPRVQLQDVAPAFIAALGAMRSPQAIALLRARARRGPSAVQLAALRALEEIGGERVVSAVMELLIVEDPAIQRASADALVRLSAREDVDGARLLLALLRSPHPHVRTVAGHLAGRIRKDETLAAAVFEGIREEDWWSRERVLEVLVELGLPKLGERLVSHLSDESPLVRRFAIFGLLKLRDPRTLPALLQHAVSDQDWWVREQAIQAIGELGDRRALPYLQVVVKHRPDLRVAALEALESMGAEDELLGHADLLADDDPGVALAMLEILERLPRGREASIYLQGCVASDEPRIAKKARELLDLWKLERDAEGSAAVGVRDRLLVVAARAGADDVLLAPGRPPYQKRVGEVSPIARGVLTEAEVESMVLPLLRLPHREALAKLQDVDVSYDVPGFDLRFRINVYREMSGIGAVFRRISQTVPALEALGLPPAVARFPDFPNGLVLVGGPTSSGKSTTLAALVNYINVHHGRHIVTIEDPIEVLHRSRESLVNQREVGTHADSFVDALRATLRQDPDVILIGELRDQETIEIAVNAAETGHLVLATVHTTSAAATIDRLVHAMPTGRQGLVRSMLAESLRAVVCQQLLRRLDDPNKRVLACELMINNGAIANLIRNDKSFQIPSTILTHRAAGMQLMDSALEDFLRAGIVDPDEAMLKSVDKTSFQRVVDSVRGGGSGAQVPPTQSGTVQRPDRSWGAQGGAPSEAPAGPVSYAPPPRGPKGAGP